VRKLFIDREAREFAYILFMLEESDKDVADRISKKYVHDLEEFHIKAFRHYYWCIENMSEPEVKEYTKGFVDPAFLQASHINDGNAFIVRKELGMGVNISDLRMLTTIKEALYVDIMEKITNPKMIVLVTKMIRELTNIMSSSVEIEKNTISDDDLKPLYRPTFEEAVAIPSMESLIEKGADILGGEVRAQDILKDEEREDESNTSSES